MRSHETSHSNRPNQYFGSRERERKHSNYLIFAPRKQLLQPILYKMKLTLLENFKPQNEPVIDYQILRLAPDTPFGNFSLKWVQFIERFENINNLIIELEQLFIITNAPNPTIEQEFERSKLYYRQKFITEQILYWLRKSADELIAVLYILDYEKRNLEYPVKNLIDSIGTLLNSTGFYTDFVDEYSEYLTMINDVSNAYKHSILNSETHNRQGMHEPVVFALSQKYNNTEKPAHSHKVALEYILGIYSMFLDDITLLIQDFRTE